MGHAPRARFLNPTDTGAGVHVVGCSARPAPRLTRERLPLAAESHQRQVHGEFQTGPILSSHDLLVEKRDDLTRAPGGLIVV